MIGTFSFFFVKFTARFSHVNVCWNQLQSKPEKKKKKLNRRRTVEVGLSKARASIREAASSNRNATLFSVDLPNAQVYRNPSALSQ